MWHLGLYYSPFIGGRVMLGCYSPFVGGCGTWGCGLGYIGGRVMLGCYSPFVGGVAVGGVVFWPYLEGVVFGTLCVCR